MPRFTFEPLYPDGSPRRHAGTWRPPYIDAEQTIREHLYSYGGGWSMTQMLDLYNRGYADRPLYHLDDDETVPRA